MRFWRPFLGIVFVCVLLLGCATIQNAPVNVAGTPANLSDTLSLNFEESAVADSTVIGLSFSGGGTRAAAYSFGVLSELERIPVRGAGGPMIDHLEFISSVSGGSVTAAYFGLKKRAGLADFREKFLLRNAEEDLQTNLNLATLSRAFAGGVNDSTGFPRWLDANLFDGATFAQFRTEKPRVWINASDIYNRTPFVFGAVTFDAICSDLAKYPLSEAVAASAAVPVAFAPVVIQSFPTKCDRPLPSWVERVRNNKNAPPLLAGFANAINNYHDGAVPFIKLLDGGLVDNFGLSGFTIARLSSETPYGPLNPKQAVKLRRALFLVVDASARGPSPEWIQTVEGPRGADLVRASTDTVLGASVAGSFTAFNSTVNDWQAALVRWRCGLSSAERIKYGAGPGWNCRDIKFFVGRLGFDQLDPARSATLETVPTRFRLSPEQVDNVIEAGRDTLRNSTVFKSFAASL
ncbi:MAG: patatin-like phospholipase family protein [Bradyrhizobiaceae bacterium]|nr:MAG: patatin-like phospholipase family protein [Bradyrhizobiaceae bacterium]